MCFYDTKTFYEAFRNTNCHFKLNWLYVLVWCLYSKRGVCLSLFSLYLTDFMSWAVDSPLPLIFPSWCFLDLLKLMEGEVQIDSLSAFPPLVVVIRYKYACTAGMVLCDVRLLVFRNLVWPLSPPLPIGRARQDHSILLSWVLPHNFCIL